MRRGSYRILTRRAFLATTAGALATSAVAGEDCRTTPANIEGPYWIPDAPFTTNLRGSVRRGEPLIVSGRVVIGSDCQPARGAVLDVWQADHEGLYDIDRGHRDEPGKWYLRGRIRADAQGRYRFETIRPAAYGLGGRMRPAHIHFKITASGGRPLTTQLYFAGDPNLESDPLRAVRTELVRPMGRSDGVMSCQFDITLRPA